MSKRISNRPTSTGSQFGGVDGIIQPPPHEPDEAETGILIRATNPSAGFPTGMNLETEPVPVTQLVVP